MVKALFILNLLPSLVITVVLVLAYFNSLRGTNSVSRFVRDVGSNVVYNTYIMYAVAVTTISILIGLIFSCVYTCIPSVLVICLAFYLKYLSTKNKQRVKDARVVTKGGGEFIESAGEDVATIACKVAKLDPVTSDAVVGATAVTSHVIGRAVSKMDDIDSLNITKEDFQELNNFASKYSGIDFKNPEKFIESANRAGIPTEGKDLASVAEKVIQNAPTAMLSALPESMSIEDKAMAIMGGVVDAEYKEIN